MELLKDKIYLDEDGLLDFYNRLDKIKKELEEIGLEKAEAYQAVVGDGWHDNAAFEEAVRKEQSKQAEKRELVSQKVRILPISLHAIVGKVDLYDKVSIVINGKDTGPSLILVTRSVQMSEMGLYTTVNGPLGRALYNKGVDEKFTWLQGDREMHGVIKRIDRSPMYKEMAKPKILVLESKEKKDTK